MRGADRVDRPARDRRIDHPHARPQIERAEELAVSGIAGKALGNGIAESIAERGHPTAHRRTVGIDRNNQAALSRSVRRAGREIFRGDR